MSAMQSTAIERIYYSARRHELFVAFKSGRVYVYFGVPVTKGWANAMPNSLKPLR